MSVFTHDPTKIQLTIAGFPITGFQEGSEPMIEPDGEVTNTSIGVDKDYTKNIRRITHKLSFTLQNGSPGNTFLSESVRSKASVPFTFLDGNNGSFATGSCHIESKPSLAGGTDAQGRAYVYRCVDVIEGIKGA